MGSWLAGQNQYAIFIEPDASQLELDGKAHFLASIGETVGPADYTTFMATDKYIRDNPEVIQSWTNAIYKAQKWTESAPTAEIVKILEPFFPGVNPQALAAAAERYRRLKIWKNTPVIEAKAIEKFQDILVQGGVLDAAKRVKFRTWCSPSSPARRSDPCEAATGGAASPKVELRDVNLRYFGLEGETEALKDISFSVAAGEFVAIIGQSGCGKSTLLSLISGILAPTEGAVLVDGKPVTGPSRKVGYMLQQDYLFEWRTILENAVLGAEIQGADMTQGAPSAQRRCSPATGSASSCTICRASSRAACASAWRSRARSAPSPTSCCSMSRSRRSIRRPGWRSPTR